MKGMTPEEMRNSHQAIEWVLLRVRHRHEKAGDAHKYTFGELLREARKELDEKYERNAPARMITEIRSLNTN